MNNILKDVEELKILILESPEYKNYDNSLKKVEANNRINELINNIKKIQKEIVKKMSKKEETKSLDNELNSLYEELYNFKEYEEYIDNSKELNILITKIQKNFEKYFNDLVS